MHCDVIDKVVVGRVVSRFWKPMLPAHVTFGRGVEGQSRPQEDRNEQANASRGQAEQKYRPRPIPGIRSAILGRLAKGKLTP